MTKLKVGDNVRVTRTWDKCEQNAGWGNNAGYHHTIGHTGIIVQMERENCKDFYTCLVEGEHIARLAYPDFVLELVRDKPLVVVLTKKVMVGDTKCREIVGFRGILACDELPAKYLNGRPTFYIQNINSLSRYVFDGVRIRWRIGDHKDSEKVVYRIPENPDPKIVLDDHPLHLLSIGDIYPESTMQAIMTWLKRASSRLAKIRREEKEAWSGEEELEI